MEVAPFFVDFHHFLSIFTIFYRFSRFTHFCRNLHFVAIYALFSQFFLAKIAFSVTSHVFCMYVFCKFDKSRCNINIATISCVNQIKVNINKKSWVSQYTLLSLRLWVCPASVTLDQISSPLLIRSESEKKLLPQKVPAVGIAIYWPSTIKYQPVSLRLITHSIAKWNFFSFYDSFDESRTIYLV